MKRALGRTAKWTGATLAALLVALVAATAFLVATETGLRWGFSLVRDFLPETVAVAALEGRLLGPLVARGVRVTTPTMDLRLEQVRLEWEPAALLSGSLHIVALTAEGLALTLKDTTEAPAEENPAPLSLPARIDLPLAVRVDRLALDGARIRTATEAEPIVIDHADLSATLANGAWRIQDLNLTGPQVELAAKAEVTPRQPYPMAVDAHWTLRLPDLAPITGTTTLNGDLEEMQLTQTLAAPYNANLHAKVADLLGARELQAELRLDETKLEAIKAGLPPATVSASLAAEGKPQALAFKGEAQATSPDYGHAALTLAGDVTPERLRIDHALLTSPDAAGRVEAEARIALAPGAPLELRLKWQDLQWPLTGAPQYTSDGGRLTVTGQPEDYRIEGELQWAVAGQAPGRLRLAGQGNLESLRLDELAVSGAPGRLLGEGQVRWAPALAASLRLEGEQVNPGALLPAWPGALDVQLAAQADAGAGGFTAEISRLHINGSLRQQPLTVALRAAVQPQRVHIAELALAYGGNSASAKGLAGWGDTDWDLAWQIEAPALADLPLPVAGSLAGSGVIRGELPRPSVRAQLHGEELSAYGYEVASLDLETSIDEGGRQPSRIALHAADLELAGTEVAELDLRAAGTAADHDIELEVVHEQAGVSLAANGSLAGLGEAAGAGAPVWHFTLNNVEVRAAQLPTLTLADPAAGRVSAQAQELEQACFSAEDARLCLQGKRSGEGLTARVEAEDLDLAWLQPWLGPDLLVAGAVSAQGQVARDADGWQGEVLVTTTAGRVATRAAEAVPEDVVADTDTAAPVTLLAFAPGRIHASLRDQQLQVDGKLPLAGTGGLELTVDAGSAAAGLMQGPLRGQLKLEVTELGFVSRLAPEIAVLEGDIAGNLQLAGSLAAPRLDGALRLNAARLGLVTPGIEMTDVALALSARGQTIAIDGQAASGGGTLRASGEMALLESGVTLDLAVTGRDFRVMDTRDAVVYVSPDLAIALNPERIAVSGEVLVPRAAITPQELPAGAAVTVSEDQVIVTAEDGPAGLGRALFVDLRLRLGDKVHFEGFGLTADIGGALAIAQRPGKPTTGTGELRVIDGEYRAYGQDLEITTGRLLFAGGPVTAPGLDVRAVRRPAPDILVGIKVRGRLKSPEFEIFSEPPMGQTAQLSWLLLGRGLDDASGAEASLIARAALALGLKGGNFLAEQIGGRLGLDEVGIESAPGTGAEQAALVVGKYLTPRLYVNYGIGLFEPVSTLRLRYTLSPLWQIRTESTGIHAGGDLMFTIEP